MFGGFLLWIECSGCFTHELIMIAGFMLVPFKSNYCGDKMSMSGLGMLVYVVAVRGGSSII
jgi:hypothetical protein